MAERTPLILDVDTGIDDALALLYACASPEVDLLAVTCIGGNVDARQVAWNTRAVLELAGRADVPVILGREEPLVKALVTTPETHGPTGIGYAVLPEPARQLERDDAADRIVALTRARPGELTLVTLGPLTNLAVALEREPDAAEPPAQLRPDGRRVQGARQYHADERMERIRRSRRGARGVRGVAPGPRWRRDRSAAGHGP